MWKQNEWDFARTRDDAQSMMWMDPLHVHAIYGLVMLNRWKRLVEVGCWDGFSTSALAQAVFDLAAGEIVCVDTDIRPNLQKVLDALDVVSTTMQGRSADVLHGLREVDVLILDGDHALEAVQAEAAIIFEKNWPTIIAHDVGRPNGGAAGPQWLMAELRQRGWYVLLDEKPRADQRTDRGLMLATQDVGVYGRSKGIFDFLAQES